MKPYMQFVTENSKH